MADEPTGNLDAVKVKGRATASCVEINAEAQSIIMVSRHESCGGAPC